MTSWKESRAARESKIDTLHGPLTGAIEFAARFRTRSFNKTPLVWTQHMATFKAGRVPHPMPSYTAGFKHWLSLDQSAFKGQAGGVPYRRRKSSRFPGDIAQPDTRAPQIYGRHCANRCQLITRRSRAAQEGIDRQRRSPTCGAALGPNLP